MFRVILAARSWLKMNPSGFWLVWWASARAALSQTDRESTPECRSIRPGSTAKSPPTSPASLTSWAAGRTPAAPVWTPSSSFCCCPSFMFSSLSSSSPRTVSIAPTSPLYLDPRLLTKQHKTKQKVFLRVSRADFYKNPKTKRLLRNLKCLRWLQIWRTSPANEDLKHWLFISEVLHLKEKKNNVTGFVATIYLGWTICYWTAEKS